MATAPREGGLYYVNGVAVDANGKEIEGAPKQPKDTDPSQQPGAIGVQSPEEKLAAALATALKGGAPQEDDEDEEGTLTLAELPDHLATISDVAELKAMKRKEKRKGGKELIAARIAEIEGE